MQQVFFLSSNKGKIIEYQNLLSDIIKIQPLELDLKETQAIKSKKVSYDKLQEAKKILSEKSFFVEDTALYFLDWNNFPGALIKWMLESMGKENIYRSLENFEKKALAECTIGYFCKQTKKDYFFQGKLLGKIVASRGENNFGWDSLFVPIKENKTFAEMKPEEKLKKSHRFLAAQKFRGHLKKFSSL